MIFYFNMLGCLAVAWLLSFAIIIDRKHIRRAWKPAMVMLVAEQGVLAFGSLEALGSHVRVEYRQILFAIVLVALIASLLIVVLTLRNPKSWWFGRDSYAQDESLMRDNLSKKTGQDQGSESRGPSRHRAPAPR